MEKDANHPKSIETDLKCNNHYQYLRFLNQKESI